MVDRYNESASGMLEDEYGQFVEYSDYTKLEAENLILQEELELCSMSVASLGTHNQRLRDALKKIATVQHMRKGFQIAKQALEDSNGMGE